MFQIIMKIKFVKFTILYKGKFAKKSKIGAFFYPLNFPIFYDVYDRCFYPSEVVIKHSNPNGKVEVPWIIAWIYRCDILRRIAIITLLLKDPKSKSNSSLGDEIKTNLIDFERQTFWIEKDDQTPFEEFWNKYEKERNELKTNRKVQRLINVLCLSKSKELKS